ncbi:uncharacterized protein LOC142612415 [Castanea sativa]|uniref:uncharacterized protein LOC142612415 n=1 Tax=Castanea sativa TaxID=21020 RepID=UPI003F64A93C
MPWIVFGNFNEIAYPHGKSEGSNRDGKQMEGFRDYLGRCGLFDLGYVGQQFTWCNGRLGNQRTKLRLYRIVRNEDWLWMYPKSSVHNFSMSIFDHCMLILALNLSQPRKPVKKQLVFEAMWTREEGCRDVVESAWDPLWCDLGLTITDKLKRCLEQLQRWNMRVFGNVNKVLQ